MSTSKAGLYIENIMEVSIILWFFSRIMAYSCLRNVFPKLEFYDWGRQSKVRSDGTVNKLSL